MVTTFLQTRCRTVYAHKTKQIIVQ